MKLDAGWTEPAALDSPLLALPWCQGASLPEPLRELDERLQGALGRVIARDFQGKKDEVAMLYGSAEGGPTRVILLGLGPRAELVPERLRAAAGRAAGRARSTRLDRVDLWVPVGWLEGELDVETAARALAEGLTLGAWHFDELRTEFDGERPGELERARLLVPDPARDEALAGGRLGATLAAAQNFARELATRPANIVTPRYLAEQARKLGDDLGFEVTTLDREAMEEEGMATLLAVAAGSEEEPRFIAMEYRGGEGRPLALVGKGVTFDSGGLSLKTSEGMESMKYDMAGAAAVLGAMKAIAELRLPIAVVGLVPSVENLPSGHALRPGDVIRSHSGKTIEVLNTDAEGRLILADALSYASRYEPAAMIDVATLTGACVVALGHHAIGLLGSDEALVEEVRRAADRSGERVWPLPLWEEYRAQLKSELADIKNTGGRPAGTIVAAMFLKTFTGSIPWAHLDIAGTAWSDEAGPYQPKGPTGVGVRLLTEWVRGRAA